MHYAPSLSNALFGYVRGMDWDVHFQFEGQASLFSKESTHKHNALILGGDERTLRIIMLTSAFEGENHTIFRKLEFLFEDADRI